MDNETGHYRNKYDVTENRNSWNLITTHPQRRIWDAWSESFWTGHKMTLLQNSSKSVGTVESAIICC